MQAFSHPDKLYPLMLILCYLLVALGLIKIALYLIMSLTPGIWDALTTKENAFYIRIGLLSEEGSKAYKKMEHSPWAKAFFGCGGLALILLAVLSLAFFRWLQSLPIWE